MSASKFAKLLYNGFGIKNVIIKSIDFIEDQGKALIFKVHLKQPLKKCSKCCSKNIHIKDSKKRRLRLVPLGKMKCFLDVRTHKFKCKDCGCSAWANLPFAAGKLPMTLSFVEYTLSMIRIGTIEAIAKFLGLQWKTVKNIHKEYLQKKYEKINYKNLVYLSMDEFSIKKGHKYMTVFLDLRSGRIIYACEGRALDCIEPFLQKLKKKARKLQAIAMDLSPTYISAIKKILPNVVIVFDRFHVVKLLNTMIDDLRKAERLKYVEQGFSIGKGDRFLFLHNFENLDITQKEKLQKLLDINTVLATAYAMKEQFRMFWNKGSKQEAAAFLLDWVFTAILSDIPGLQKMGYTILNHGEGLLAYYDHSISNGKIEGTNNKIKVKKRQGYGYRDMEYFTLLLYDLHEKAA